MKHTLLFATIASFVVVHAYANNIVTSKTYVDGRDALKVDIAQGTGDNNANVGKTLVVNSSGNLELGTPAAANYVEDAITNDVTNKAPSENAVHDALAGKQDAIETDTVTFTDVENQEVDYEVPSLVAFDSTHGINGTQIGLVDLDNGGDGLTFFAQDMNMNPGNTSSAVYDNYVPTYRTVAMGLRNIYDNIDALSGRIPDITPITWVAKDTTAVNAYGTTFGGSGRLSWPAEHENQYVTGASLAQGLALKQNKLAANNSTNNPNGSLVTYGTTAGQPGSKKIVTTVASGGTDIPTDGAVYTAISGKQDTITTAEVAYTEPEERINYQLPSLVAYDSTNGLSGSQIGVLDLENGGSGLTFLAADMDPWDSSTAVYDNYVPTVRTVAGALNDIWNIWDNIPSPITWDSNDTTAVNNYSTSFTGTGNWPSAHRNQYVDGWSLAQGLALKQNKITTSEVNYADYSLPAIVVYDSTNGLNGNRIGILDEATLEDEDYSGAIQDVLESIGDNYVPTARAVAKGLYLKQAKIPASGYNLTGRQAANAYTEGNGGMSNDWLNTSIKGTGLVTRTTIDGHVGERKIFETSDVNNYHATNLSQNQKDIQDISIPTVGAMMATVGGKQTKKTCAGWPDGAEHTDANCWLWNMPD